MPSTSTLSDLPGKPGKTEVLNVRTVTGIITALRSGGAATTAADNGALNAWIDDDGFYRGESFRYCVTTSAICTKRMSVIRVWIKEWLAKIQ